MEGRHSMIQSKLGLCCNPRERERAIRSGLRTSSLVEMDEYLREPERVAQWYAGP